MSARVGALVFGRVELRLAERRVLVDGQPVALGSRAFDLLQALVNKRDRVVSKDELLDEVWPGLVVEENNLQVQISGLRRVLGSQSIATVAGQGYRFTLAPGSAPTPGVASPVRRAVRAADLVVADDNRVHRLLLCRSLELMGHRVKSAENGRQALRLLREQPVDLLLLDLAMPELDGFALLQARSEEPGLREVPVIVTSALDGVAPVARCIELGADDFLHKPVDPWLLRARVESSLLLKQQRDRLAQLAHQTRAALPEQVRSLPDANVLAARLRDADQADCMDLLGDWGTLMADAVARQGGQLVRFSGDALLALFGDAAAARQAAHDMAQLQTQFNAELALQGRGALVLDIGLARGPLRVGAAQAGAHAAFVCLGLAVQRAEGLAEDCAQRGVNLLLDAQMQ